jgi:hypothetical protein
MFEYNSFTGEPMRSSFGPNPMGPRGRMIAVLRDRRPKLPDDEAEREYNF